jgi:predicted acetyltransferase
MPIQLINSRKSPDHQDWIRKAFVAYLGDLSPYDASCRHLAKWIQTAADPLMDWFTHQDMHIFVFGHDGGARVGFAFVSQSPYRGVTPGVDFRVGEFYIVPEHRRCGLGRLAAQALFNRFPGTWEVTQLSGNESALSFWREVIGVYTKGRYEESLVDGRPRQVFQSKGREGRSEGFST